MKMMIAILSLLGLSLATSSAIAADANRGATLHNEQCMACHAARFSDAGNEIYTRSDRRVQSLAALQKQVDRCKNNLQIVWFDEDVADVVAHLNATFYKFPAN
jgi:Skp family chaperone for outer membrane proteins